MTSRAKELFDASVDQVRRGDVRAGLTTLLDALAADSSHRPALEAAARLCRLLGSSEDADLFERAAQHPHDPATLFSLGWRMVEQTRPDVAVDVLRRGLAGARGGPDEVPFRRELAIAQHLHRDFAGCLDTLAPLADDGDLVDAEALDVALLSAEAALYAGHRGRCRLFLEQAEALVPDDGQRARLDALHELLGRAARWPELAALRLREWHFIQHAGVILKVAGGWFEDGSRGGRYDVLDLRPDMVAFLLQRLLHLLEDLDVTVDAVAATSATAAPMAHALGQRAGLAVLSPDALPDGARTLLVAASAGELAPFTRPLSRHTAEVRVFALNLDWSREAPICPEVAGVLARRVFLPWEARYAVDPGTQALRPVPADERPADELGELLALAMDSLPDDGGGARAEFDALYAPLRDELLLGNEDRYPHRRVFTPLSPCWPTPDAQAGASRSR